VSRDRLHLAGPCLSEQGSGNRVGLTWHNTKRRYHRWVDSSTSLTGFPRDCHGTLNPNSGWHWEQKFSDIM
jgi:hypothetical protein